MSFNINYDYEPSLSMDDDMSNIRVETDPTAIHTLAPRPTGPRRGDPALAAARKRPALTYVDQEPTAPPAAVPRAPPTPSRTEADLQAINEDLYNKLCEKEARIATLEEEVRARTSEIDTKNGHNSNLEQEVSQYATDLARISQERDEINKAAFAAQTAASRTIEALEAKYTNVDACFNDAQASNDDLKRELKAAQDTIDEQKRSLDGAHNDYDILHEQLQQYQARDDHYNDAERFMTALRTELDPHFGDMGRELTPDTIINHIQDLNSAASAPRRKANRKVSMADELANHTDEESEVGDDEDPDALGGMPDPYNEEEVPQSGAHSPSQKAAAPSPQLPTAQTPVDKQAVFEILARYTNRDATSPADLDVANELEAALKRATAAEAELTELKDLVDKKTRLEGLVDAEKARRETADKAASRTRAIEGRTIFQQQRKRVSELEKLVSVLVPTSSDRSASITEANNLRTAVQQRESHISDLESRIADLEKTVRAFDSPFAETNEGIAIELRTTNRQQQKRIAELEKALPATQPVSPPIKPAETVEVIVYRDVVREKTTLEWLQDSPVWWQCILAMLVVFLCMGNYSAWSERHAWVVANVPAMDFLRSLMTPSLRQPHPFTMWIENSMGFDRRHLG